MHHRTAGIGSPTFCNVYTGPSSGSRTAAVGPIAPTDRSVPLLVPGDRKTAATAAPATARRTTWASGSR